VPTTWHEHVAITTSDDYPRSVGHHITALAIAAHHASAIAESYGLIERLRWNHVTLFPIDHYWSAYWQAKRGGVDGTLGGSVTGGRLPSEGVVRAIARELTGLPAPRFAVIQSDYHGGSGDQWALAFEGERSLLDVNASVNHALRELGVDRDPGLDEWDTIGLGDFRSNPDHLDRFQALCDESGA